MSAISRRPSSRHRAPRRVTSSRREDPRVLRTRAAATQAATTFFLQKGYAGTTMDDIAALAGLTKRTLYNNYRDKTALFTEIVSGVMTFAERFARDLRAEFAANTVSAATLPAALHDLARRLALGIFRPQVIALRRLLIAEARTFPDLASTYYDRAPGQVIATIASWFARLNRAGLLRVTHPRRAAQQFAYLTVGEPLDRAMLVGTLPSRAHVLTCAHEGVETFIARYGRIATRQ